MSISDLTTELHFSIHSDNFDFKSLRLLLLQTEDRHLIL